MRSLLSSFSQGKGVPFSFGNEHANSASDAALLASFVRKSCVGACVRIACGNFPLRLAGRGAMMQEMRAPNRCSSESTQEEDCHPLPSACSVDFQRWLFAFACLNASWGQNLKDGLSDN